MSKKMHKEKIEGQKVTENIYLCTDGKYRWTYAFDMLKNPVILFTTWKVIWISFIVVYLFVLILDISDGIDMNGFVDLTRGFVLITLFMCVLGVAAYLIIAGQYGRRYMVIFEMDESGITHRQMRSQFDKAKAMGFVTAMAGIAAGSLTAAGAGINAATRDSLSTDFDKVKKIKALKRRNTIYLNAPFSNNQIYASDGDFDFVLEYILKYIPENAKRKL